MKLIGNSRHKIYAGTQLFDASKLSTISSGGATVTNNGDGSFTISGTGNLNSDLYIDYAYTHEETMELLKAGTITLKTSSVSNPRVEVSLRKADGIYISLSNRYNPVDSVEIKQEFLDDPNSKLMLSFYMPSNSEIKPGTIKPMLYQNGVGEWEPFTGGKPVTEPSPDIPLDIKSVGRYDENTGEYLIGVKVTGKNLLDISSEAISGKNADGKYNIQDGVITFNTINHWGGDYIYFNSIDTRNNKNLTFSGNATLSENPSDIGRGCRILVIAYDKNGALLTDVDTIFAEKSYQWIYNEYYKGFIGSNRINEGLSAKLTDEVDKITVGVCYSNTVADYPVRISDVQVEYGTVNTDYEPYTEQSVQIALDELLRGVGEYKDEIDFKRGKYVQRILKAKPNQPIVFKIRDPNGRCATFDQKLFDVEFKTADSPALSTIAKYSSWANGADGTFALTQLNGFYYKDSRKTLEEVNEIFAKLGTNFEICGVLETPIEHDLPQEVIEAYKQLHSENGITHVFVDSGEVETGIKIAYKQKK